MLFLTFISATRCVLRKLHSYESFCLVNFVTFLHAIFQKRSLRLAICEQIFFKRNPLLRENDTVKLTVCLLKLHDAVLIFSAVIQ